MDFSVRLISVIIPMIPLQIPWSISELFKYITRSSGWRQTYKGRLVLDLNIWSEKKVSHCRESITSVTLEIRNQLSETGRVLQIILLICWTVSLKPMIWVVLRRLRIGDLVINLKWRCCSIFQVSAEIELIWTYCSIL